jgi:hypothetical protein
MTDLQNTIRIQPPEAVVQAGRHQYISAPNNKFLVSLRCMSNMPISQIHAYKITLWGAHGIAMMLQHNTHYLLVIRCSQFQGASYGSLSLFLIP